VSILAEIGERAEAIDLARAEEARRRAEERMKTIREEQGFEEARQAYVRAVTRLAVARRRAG
jgi:F-type H+-transporting ATPase subunit epsilon